MDKGINILDNLEILPLPEQDTSLLISDFSVIKQNKDIYLIAGNELYCRCGLDDGHLMVGLMRLKKVKMKGSIFLKREIIIPFSNKLLLVNFLENEFLEVVFMENNSNSKKIIKINELGNVNYADYEFLLDKEKINKELLNVPHFIEIPKKLIRKKF